MIVDTRPLMVTIRCLTYNQERYIRECLEGFVMQKTNFRFEAIVHDDASTDGTPVIIREYAEKYPDIIKPIYETENQYSKHDGSLVRIMDEHTLGRYVAICEGDDYWTDPMKLQKQFDFMEAHPECSMCFHAHHDYYADGRFVLITPKKRINCWDAKDVIRVENNIIGTNTMFYRWDLLKNEGRPLFWKNCPVGDFPSMLFFASKGAVGYIDESMSVYRQNSVGSWTNRKTTLKMRIAHRKRIIEMYKQFNLYSHKKYQKYVYIEIALLYKKIIRNIISTTIKSIIPKHFLKRL